VKTLIADQATYLQTLRVPLSRTPISYQSKHPFATKISAENVTSPPDIDAHPQDIKCAGKS